jgi:hypothetical protein
MLRPWVPLIALGLLLALAWQYQPQLLVWIGGALLAWAVLAPLPTRLKFRWRKAQAEKRALELDWKIIDQSVANDRLQRDCERPETLGTCTGRECLVYDTCSFNIKKPLP